MQLGSEILLDGTVTPTFSIEDTGGLGPSMGDGFYAELHADTLNIGWHGGRRNLAHRLNEVNAPCGGAQIKTVMGTASPTLEDIIKWEGAGAVN